MTNADGSAPVDIGGYKLYYGPASRTYTNCVDLGAVTNAAVWDLEEGLTHYFALTAYNSAGSESELSEEMMWTAPAGLSICLCWDPPLTNSDGSAVSDLAGYELCWGMSSREYTFRRDVGNATNALVSGIEPGRTYYFAIAAYNAHGGKSALSEEVVWTSGSGTLGDRVWHDLDGDGLQDTAEPGLGGVSVRLYGSSTNLVAETVTAADGSYAFMGLGPGQYCAAFDPPMGFALTSADRGKDDRHDSDADPGTRRTALLTLGTAEENVTCDAGLYRPATVGDLVWNDLDLDGTRDPGEPGVADVLVELLSPQMIQLAFTVTDDSGAYGFGGVQPGTYYLRFTPPAGFGILSDDAPPRRDLNRVLISLTSGTKDLNVDFALNWDCDRDAMPDPWEELHFGGSEAAGGGAAEDFDGDGVPNLEEYVAGTDPTNGMSYPALNIVVSEDGVDVRFQAAAADGTGYDGKSRYYRLEESANLRGGEWRTVPGFEAVSGAGQAVTCAAEPNRFYRSRIWLE